MFGDRLIKEDSNYFIEVYNKVEHETIKSKLEEINSYFKKFGFKTSLDIKLNENKRDEIQKEIEESNKFNNNIFENKKDYNKKIEEQKSFNKEKTYKNNVKKEVKVTYEMDNVTVEGYIFGIMPSTKKGFNSFTLKFSDLTTSMYVRIYAKTEEEYNELIAKFKENMWIRVNGYVKNNPFYNDFVLNARNIEKIDSKLEEIKDLEEEKRVELHAHTKMSQMDGVVEVKDLIKQACKWGHKAIAITDHNSIQTFPECYHHKDEIKILYGVELSMIDDDLDLVFRSDDSVLLDNTYVVFDFETTGFNAGGKDSIIEIGAVKLKNGEIIDKFDMLINPGKPLSPHISELTGITDFMLKDAPTEEEAVKEFIKWTGNLPMVAHNAKFDASFLTMAYKKYNLGEYTNPLLDTLELSRAIEPTAARHSLSALVKRYDIPWDEESHHRGDYDAEATALIFYKMLEYLSTRKIEKMNQINDLVAKDDIHKFGNLYHVNLLVKNKKGLKNLFKIVSYANTKYLYKTPRILRSVINELREGILVGSSCSNGEIFSLARSKSDDELANLMDFYDYIEIQPLDVYSYLIDTEDFKDYDEIKENVNKIIRVANNKDKIVVATGDVHHLTKKDKLYRQIIINQKVPGGGFHPLNKSSIKDIPSQHFRTTREMLDDFSFLNEDEAKKIVVENTNKVADMVEEFEIIPDTKGIPFSPIFENSKEIIKDISYKKAHEIYGEDLPDIVKERLDTELNGIINGGFDAIYLIAQKLVKHSNDDGYYVGSRGSVGSSFAATMLGITEVNPLPAHYVCPNCKKTIFTDENNRMYNLDYASGYDLPDRKCECGAMMNKDGQDMPFATFLGFNADKVPDIDLNFSGDYQAKAHEYTKVLFGEDYVYRAGTIGTVADKTAFGYVKGYFEDRGIPVNRAEIQRLSVGCTGIKKTTGQHPGGIIVVPKGREIYEFTPVQHPADDPNSDIITTHFDYHSIDANLLKLDILGHDDPTVIRMLQDLTGIAPTQVPLDDKETMSIFNSTDALGVTPEQIHSQVGTFGIPEYGTKFARGMLLDTHPTTFDELIRLSGLSHGTDVWLGNAQTLIEQGIVTLQEAICCRDDIMIYLIKKGVPPDKSFKIMETVRKGKALKDPVKWEEFKAIMKEHDVPDWYIKSCEKIKYMFPKAHAAAYVTNAFRIAWFKVHIPLAYYAAYYSIRAKAFDAEFMINGKERAKNKMKEIEMKNQKKEATKAELDMYDDLEIVLEMYERGFEFLPVDIYESEASKFKIQDNKLRPPLNSIPGFGTVAAQGIVNARKDGKFMSIDDLKIRAKIGASGAELLKQFGCLEGMSQSNQLSLFG